jgi:hypothetical protein
VIARLIIISNLCLLVILIFAIGRSKLVGSRKEVQPTEPPRQLLKQSTRPSQAEILSALPKPRHASTGDRLQRMQSLLRQIENSDRPELNRIQSDLNAASRAGYDTQIERQLVDYKRGQLGGDDPTRWNFPSGDSGVYARALILEGWANTHPREALAWWQNLGAGNRRDSLLKPLVQGYLSAQETSWRDLLPVISREELAQFVGVFLDSAIDHEDSELLIQSLDEELSGIDSAKRRRLAVTINDHLCAQGDYDSLKEWYTIRMKEESPWDFTGDRYNELVRAIGAKGGARALEWLPPGELMRAARSWVKTDLFAAGKWLEGSPRNDGADQVAFYLAIDNVTANIDASREWASFITDEQMAETIDAIISGYEER